MRSWLTGALVAAEPRRAHGAHQRYRRRPSVRRSSLKAVSVEMATRSSLKMSALPAENVRQIEPQALVTMTPMDMLARAVQSGADLDMIEKLMNLQERWEAGNARKAFEESLAKAKGEIPVIIRNASGHNSKKYADFCRDRQGDRSHPCKVWPSYRFRTTQTDKISVTCVLFRHGHSGGDHPLRPGRCFRQQECHPGDRLHADLPPALFAGAGARACCRRR